MFDGQNVLGKTLTIYFYYYKLIYFKILSNLLKVEERNFNLKHVQCIWQQQLQPRALQNLG